MHSSDHDAPDPRPLGSTHDRRAGGSGRRHGLDRRQSSGSSPTGCERRLTQRRSGQDRRASLENLEPRIIFSADPVTADNPVWFVPRGEAIIDGTLDDADWADAAQIYRTVPTHANASVTVSMMYNDAGIFLATDAADQYLWADGDGNGAGNRWDVGSDDGVTFYFDPDSSREQYLQPNDYGFGVNIANFTDPNDGTNDAVRRYKYINGDGAGGAPDAGWFGGNWFDIQQAGGDPLDYYIPAGVAYANTYVGTINDNSDLDSGWSSEIFIPWSAIGMSTPAHYDSIGMNFDVIFDTQGGTRDLTDNRDAPNQFVAPHFYDDHVLGVHSSYSATQAGVRGPSNYAQVVFVDARAATPLPAIADAAVTNPSPHGAQLRFTSPSTPALAYEIRLSTDGPINSEARWASATRFEQAYVPRAENLAEMIRLAELEPNTTYHVAVRAIDGAGNLGSLGPSASVTTSPADGTAGRIIPSPMGRTFMFENGDSYVPTGDHFGVSWAYGRNLYPGTVWDNGAQMFHNFNENPSFEGEAGPFFDMLEDHGVNTLRVYLELQNVHIEGNPNAPEGLYWIENQAGQYNPNMRAFLDNLLAEAAAHGIYLIITPFDSFSYDESFGLEGPWATNFGGPLTDINDFFQTPETLQIAKDRMSAVASWVQQSPHGHHVVGYEPISEWDSYEWTLNAEGNAEPGRETEFRTRAIWIQELAAHIREVDPDRLVLNSTIARDPRGPAARVNFYGRDFDALTPHLYTNSNMAGINNPFNDRSVMPAIENSIFTSYWSSNRTDRAPIINGEWGMTRTEWPNELPRYSFEFTQAEDEAIFRTMMWSGLANGQAGMGLRIATDELAGYGFQLTPTMRDLELSFNTFVSSTSLGLDWNHFNYDTMIGRVAASADATTLHAWSVSDGSQGVAYVLQDGNVSGATVVNGQLVIRGLTRDQIFDLEIWDTGVGVTGAMQTITGIYAGDGTLVIDLPEFTTDLAIKYKARESGGMTQTVVSVPAAQLLATFQLGQDGQPIAQLVDATTGQRATLDVASLANFRGTVVDMTAFTTADGRVHLALTDVSHNLWLLSGDINNPASWSSTNLTAAIDAPGITGDLTTYQPSWGSVHIAGLDARGHAINYWWAPGLESWQYNDLTDEFDGPTMSSGLTGYVASWDGLNLAGLNDQGETIVYWWAPGLDAWQVLNMTESFDGPTFTGQLDAYVTSWGGLNVAGLTEDGSIYTYWWAPDMETDPDRWRVTNLTELTNAPTLAHGTEVTTSPDGGINVFASDDNNNIFLHRWLPGADWEFANVTAFTGASISTPMGSSAGGNRLVLAGYDANDPSTLILFDFVLSGTNVSGDASAA